MNDPEGANQRIRVLIVDDHDLFRTGLAALLGAEPDLEVAAQASGGRAGVRLAEELDPDVILMDLRMPDLEGSAATREIVRRNPSARVIALTVLSDEADVETAVQLGACGFLAKETPVAEIVAAVRAAIQGSAWLSPRAADVVLGRLRRDGARQPSNDQPAADLSPRELDVLQLIARGMDNTEIASTLQISPRTAKNHVSSILTKLGVPGRVQAAIYAVRHGLD